MTSLMENGAVTAGYPRNRRQKSSGRQRTVKEEGLLAAIEFEREGHGFYGDAAARATNPLASRIFSALAVEEVEHRMRLDTQLRELREGSRWRVATSPGSNLEQVVKDYFLGTYRERLRENLAEADNVRAIEAALETERRGMQMYDDLIARAEDDEERGLFQSLKDEEVEHLKALENVHAYLSQTGDWFQREESQVWNWMNT
jgi:rubrerythrin